MTEKNKTQEIITEASSQGLTVKQRVQIGNRRSVKRRRNFVLPLVCFAVLFALMFCIGSIESNSAASAKSPEGTPNCGLQLTFLGDIMMGRYIGQMCDDKGYDRLFSGISGIWSNSDHVFANFGSPVRTGDTSGYQKRLDGIPLIVVPKSYFPENVEFIITNQAATTSPVKLSEYKIHDNPPGINGWLVEGRVYYDAFVLENKKSAIYVFKTAE